MIGEKIFKFRCLIINKISYLEINMENWDIYHIYHIIVLLIVLEKLIVFDLCFL